MVYILDFLSITFEELYSTRLSSQIHQYEGSIYIDSVYCMLFDEFFQLILKQYEWGHLNVSLSDCQVYMHFVHAIYCIDVNILKYLYLSLMSFAVFPVWTWDCIYSCMLSGGIKTWKQENAGWKWNPR